MILLRSLIIAHYIYLAPQVQGLIETPASSIWKLVFVFYDIIMSQNKHLASLKMH